MIDLIKHVTLTIILPLVIILTIIGCSESEPKVKPQRNYEGKPLVITVHAFDSKKKLIKATKDYGTVHQAGLAVWSPDDNKCDVYVLRSKKADSNRYNTWGHELGHCLYGSFHK